MTTPHSDSSNSPFMAADHFSSPFFINNNDNPSTILVTPPLNGENYHSWSRAMEMALGVENKSMFIDGSLVIPSVTDPNYAAWYRNNLMI